MSVKIAIIDDNDLFREGLVLILNQIDKFEIIFNTSNGFFFLDFIKTQKPDIVLMDIEMPEINGIETTKKALKIVPDLKIIAITMFENKEYYNSLVELGIKGFLLKHTNKKELKQAIIDVFNDRFYFAREILQKFALNIDKKANSLTNRELEVLGYICKGYTTSEIAEKLFISSKTVEAHRTNLFQKAKVRNIAELIIWAIKNNLYSI